MCHKSFASILLIAGLSLGSSGAAVIASTSFDGRTATDNVASGLNWTTTGVADPGNMAAFQFGGVPQNLFNTTTLAQNNFAPGLNVGNSSTVDTQSWTTAVSLTVLAGSTVTVEDITFDYVPMNGSQNFQVSRSSDFTFTLFNPSNVDVGSFSIEGAVAGSPGPDFITINQSFPSPIALSEPGTYTLAIRGGDFLGDDETGNHTAIDNLFINGTVGAVPEPSAAILSVWALAGLVSLRRRK